MGPCIAQITKPAAKPAFKFADDIRGTSALRSIGSDRVVRKDQNGGGREPHEGCAATGTSRRLAEEAARWSQELSDDARDHLERGPTVSIL